MNKTHFSKLLRYHVRRLAYNIKLLRVMKSISREKYDEKVSASLLYGFLSAIAVNFFFQPGHVYSSGATGLAQILSVLSHRFIGFTIPVSLTFYAINIPLMIVAWYQIGHKFTIFTFITVSMSSFFIQFVPVVTLTNDPIMNALFGGVVMGTGIGFALRNNISSGGTDIVSLTIRKRTGKNVEYHFLFGQWDHHADCRSDFWLEICSLFDDYHLCVEPSNRCCLYQTKTDAGHDCNEPARCYY